jgi:hypothetical protein
MTTSGGDLEQVRSELRRLGYLDHGFERFLLQDALRPRRPMRTLLRLGARVALLSGAVLAALLALALSAANGNLTASPLDLPALFLHLFPPIFLVSGLAFLALCGVLLLVLRFHTVRRIESVSLAISLIVGIAVLALALWAARGLLAEGQRSLVVVLAVTAPLAVAILVRLLDQGLLTLAIRFTDAAPQTRRISPRRLGLAILGLGFLLTLPAVLSAGRHEPAPPPPTLPTAPGERVLLIGIDGVLPEELDYLVRVGDLPALGRLLRGGGGVWSYPRRTEPPASFWTSVATGVPGPDHGVTSLDSFRPLGVRTPLARNGPLRAWWSRVEVPLGLAEDRAVLANRRRAFTLWELAARGGEPVLSVNWWGTFPAETVPGLVIAHGAFQLLEEGASGAVAPESARKDAENRLRRTKSIEGTGKEDAEVRVRAALPAPAAAAMLDRAIVPDRFYREAFRDGLAAAPRAAALYLPGLDIAADGWQGGDVAFADLVRAELGEADRLLAAALDGSAGTIGTVVVVVDPGRRRQGGEGRALLWRRAGCGGSAGRLRAEQIASGLLRALGLPQSAELPPPPGACHWAPPGATVAGFGEPRRTQPGAPEGSEYLQSLRSLGYL